MEIKNIFLTKNTPKDRELVNIFSAYTSSILRNEIQVGIDGRPYYLTGRCEIDKSAKWYQIINDEQDDLINVNQDTVDKYIRFLEKIATDQENENRKQGELAGCGNLPSLIYNGIIPVLQLNYLYWRPRSGGKKSKKHRRNRRHKKTRRKHK